MASSINYPPDARGKWSLPVLVALVAVSALSFVNFRHPSRDEMINAVTSRIRAGQFERLYEEASYMLQSNVSKERFVRRMEVATARMRAIDGRLNFRRDTATESIFFKDEHEADSQRVVAAERLEGGGNSAVVLMSWDKMGKLFELSVIPKGDTPKEYEVYGVGAQQYHVGGKPLDW